MKRIAIISLSCAAITGVVVSCTSGQDSAVVQFELDQSQLDGETTPDGFEVRDLRFYVHDVVLLAKHGQTAPVQLSPDSNWQTEDVALIDLTGSSDTTRNAELRGSFDRDLAQFDGIRFTVGVPFDLNHANPLVAKPPLDRGELFWSWQTGYKFMRVDLAGTRGEWSFHLGSTGCASASALRPPGEACAQPNSIRIELRGFDPLREPIRVRLDAFASWMSKYSPGACTGSYAQSPRCAEIYAATGLDLATGACENANCEGQRVFAVE